MMQLKKFARRFRAKARLVKWMLGALATRESDSKAEKRLLAVYDTNRQPVSIGDFLIFLEAALIIAERDKREKIDICLIYNKEKPWSSDPVFRGKIDSDNVLYQMMSLIPLIQLNFMQGDFYLMDSIANLDRMLMHSGQRYAVWPSRTMLAQGDYLFYEVLNHVILPACVSGACLPSLQPGEHLSAWADAFMAKHAAGKMPVSVNLRNNQAWGAQRNSNFDEWLKFFEYCAERHEIQFFVLCAAAEVDERLRRLSNVVVLRDHYSGIEKDMAMIYRAAMHMGAASGPAAMAWFGEKPMLIVNSNTNTVRERLLPGVIEDIDADTQRYVFSRPGQIFHKLPETFDILVSEFEKLSQMLKLEKQSKREVVPHSRAMSESWMR